MPRGRITFSLEAHPWLKDHAVGGTPWVPGVMGLELFAEAGAAASGRVPEGLSEVRYHVPLKLLRGKAMAARLESVGGRLELRTDFVNPAGIKLGGPRTHFSARPEPDGPMPEPSLPRPAGRLTVPAEEIYSAYFHGPSFQVLAGMEYVDDKELLAVFRQPAAPLWTTGSRRLAFCPLLIEAAFQACGYRDHHVSKKMTLPDSIGAVWVRDHGERPGSLAVLGRFKGKDADGKSLYDAWVYDAEGRVWAALRDYKMVVAA